MCISPRDLRIVHFQIHLGIMLYYWLKTLSTDWLVDLLTNWLNDWIFTMSALRPVITKATRWKSGIWSDLRSTWKSLDVPVQFFFIHAPAFESLTVSGCFAQKWIRQTALRPDLIRFARCASFVLLCLFSFSSPGLFPEKVGVENPWKRSPRCKVFYVIGWIIV